MVGNFHLSFVPQQLGKDKGWLELLAFSHRLGQEQFLFCMLFGFAFMFLFDGKRILLLYERNRGGLRDYSVRDNGREPSVSCSEPTK